MLNVPPVAEFKTGVFMRSTIRDAAIFMVVLAVFATPAVADDFRDAAVASITKKTVPAPDSAEVDVTAPVR